jgi:hypothetical protein
VVKKELGKKANWSHKRRDDRIKGSGAGKPEEPLPK